MVAAVEAVAEKVIAQLREDCASPLTRLDAVAAAMEEEMTAGLREDGGSKIKMIVSYVDNLPNGFVSRRRQGGDRGGCVAAEKVGDELGCWKIVER